MKTLAIFLTSGLWLLASGICSAADLTLTDGRTFRDATILSQSAAYVSIRHAAGLTSVPKAQLPAELLAQYPIQKPEAKGRTKRVSAEMVSGAVGVKPLARSEAEGCRSGSPSGDPTTSQPQTHTVTYRVESRTPGTRITITFPEAPRDPSLPPIKTVKRKNFTPPPPTPGRKSFVMQADGYGAWSETITAPDGFRVFLRVGELGTNPDTARFAQDATLIMLVDGSEVRREKLEPRKGPLELRWTLGLADADQPAIVRSADKSNDSEGWVVSPSGRSRSKITHQDPGFKWTDDE